MTPPDPLHPGAAAGGTLSRSARMRTLLLWPVPALFVVLYLLLIRFFHAAAWSPLIGYGLLGLLLIAILVFSPVWYAVGWLSGRFLGTYAPWTVLRLLASLPLWPRRVVLTPLGQTPEGYGRTAKFLTLFALVLVFEVIYLAGSQRRGVTDPFEGSVLAGRFLLDVLLGGVLLGLLLSPAAPHLLGRLRLHIVGTLEFPMLWLTMMLLLVGGVTAALYALFPFTNGGLSHLLLSLLVYAPAAWYLSLGFLATDGLASDGLLSLARSHPTPGIVVGRLQVREESTGKVTEA